ncbi:MAG: hypothetical protein WBW06_15355, partial [Xanthobacteraceae bacterium]
MTNFVLRLALLAGAIGLVCLVDEAQAFKRRPTGCDWIGGDFADPATSIFRRGGCHGGGGHRRLARPVQQPDEPPKLLDRFEVRAPVNYGANTRKSIGAGIERFEIVGGTVAYGLDGGARLWRFALGGNDSAKVAQSVSQFRVTEAGQLFVLATDGTLWRAEGDGSQATLLDHTVGDFQP